MKRFICAAAVGLFLASAPARADTEWRAPSAAEQALDAAAFNGVNPAITDSLPDVQSVVVVLRGRVVHEFYRDGTPDKLRDAQSVAKSALTSLVGIAIGQGRIASLDQPVVDLVPEWAALNGDPRAAAIKVRHLVTMTAGFEVNDPTGTASAGRPAEAWARPLRTAPGEKFAYDNALIPMVVAVLEKAAGMPLADYARQEIVGPLGLQEPSYQRGFHMRTADMARLGQLYLQKGAWAGKPLIPEAYALAATRPQNNGGPPVSMPYGYMWWIVPSNAARPTFMASGYGGQLVWVYPPLEMVVAITSTVSQDSQRRGQAIQLLRGKLFPAAQQRAASAP
ncbi:MAG: serine hydrolase [Ramlibacter sp.]|nr:serine hydrolase [Ramlibacter sp.]